MNSFFGVTFVFVLLRFRLYAFVEAATLRSIVLRYAGAPIATRVSFFVFPFFVYLEMSLFPRIFCTICGEHAGTTVVPMVSSERTCMLGTFPVVHLGALVQQEHKYNGSIPRQLLAYIPTQLRETRVVGTFTA